ncbi:MAG: hypothetical protein ACYDEA_07780 [Candidatus Dormibacteria bacterium]
MYSPSPTTFPKGPEALALPYLNFVPGEIVPNRRQAEFHSHCPE